MLDFEFKHRQWVGSHKLNILSIYAIAIRFFCVFLMWRQHNEQHRRDLWFPFIGQYWWQKNTMISLLTMFFKTWCVTVLLLINLSNKNTKTKADKIIITHWMANSRQAVDVKSIKSKFYSKRTRDGCSKGGPAQ